MKKDDVKIGGNYLAKVSDKLVTIRIDAENRSGGWDATNLATGKKVRIKSAQRLRGPSRQRDASQRARAVAEVQAADAVANAHAVGPRGRQPRTSTVDAGGGIAVDVPQPAVKVDRPQRTSALNAAAQVLHDAKAPMRCKEMIAAMQDQGMWASPKGKTPEATLYSAILREIGNKADQSRFRKLDRGLFETNA